jgi:hypothetical protein
MLRFPWKTYIDRHFWISTEDFGSVEDVKFKLSGSDIFNTLETSLYVFCPDYPFESNSVVKKKLVILLPLLTVVITASPTSLLASAHRPSSFATSPILQD